MKMNKMILAVLIAILVSSCIVSVSGSRSLVIDGGKLILHGSGDHFVHIDVPASYEYDSFVLEGKSEPGMHSLWRYIGPGKNRQLKGTASVIFTPGTHKNIYVDSGERIPLIVGGHSPTTVTTIRAHSKEARLISTPKTTVKTTPIPTPKAVPTSRPTPTRKLVTAPKPIVTPLELVYKASDISISKVSDVVLEVGEKETMHFRMESNHKEHQRWRYCANIDDTRIITMIPHGKVNAHWVTLHPGQRYGEYITVKGRSVGRTKIALSLESEFGPPVFVRSQIKIEVVPKPRVEAISKPIVKPITTRRTDTPKELSPTPSTNLGEQSVPLTKDSGIMEYVGRMLKGGWSALMDFFH